MAKLSANQESALARLREEYGVNPRAKFSAYDLKVSLATLNALRSKGYIVQITEPGAMFYPRSCIMFRYCPDVRKMPDEVKPVCVGSSSDGRTNKWQVKCPKCNRMNNPVTTRFATQSFECDCGTKFFADWNAETVKVTYAKS